MISEPIQVIPVPNQRLFGTRAAADYLGVSIDTLRTYTYEGLIEARELNGRRVYLFEELNRFIDELPEYEPKATLRGGGKPGGKEHTYGS